jgi:hypothetical protein
MDDYSSYDSQYKAIKAVDAGRSSMNKQHWELLNQRSGEFTERLAVPGGWLYRTVFHSVSENQPGAVAMIFVPCPPPTSST